MSFKIFPQNSHAVTRLITVIALALVLTAVVLISSLRLFDPYEDILLDFRFHLRPVQPFSDKIAIIEVADDSLKQLGVWPLPRDFHASLIDVLASCNVRQIMFDVLFVEPTAEDGALEKSVKDAGNVYLPFVFRLDSDNLPKRLPLAKNVIAPLLPRFSDGIKATGYINSYKDSDGKVRWAPLVVEHQAGLKPQIALQMACDYLGVPFDNVRLKKNTLYIGNQIKIPVSGSGAILADYAGPWSKTFRHYSYADILVSFQEKLSGRKPRVNLDELKDAVCFIGLTATGTSDLHAIPLENNYPMVGLHANIFNSILSGRYIRRAGILLNDVVLLLLLVLVFFITSIKKTRPMVAFYWTVGSAALFFIFGAALFVWVGLWIDLFYPIALMLIAYTAMSIYNFLQENKKRELIEKELSIAKQIQESFLPLPIEEFGSLEVAMHMTTAKHVGGDLYDLCELGKYKLGIFLGDVSGKGVGAALFMAKTISLFRMLVGNSDEPSDVIFQLNEHIARDIKPGVFVTAVYLIYTAQSRKALIASAGHSATIILRKDGRIEKIEPKEGMPLGLMQQVEFSQEAVTLEPGDKIVLYTDGIVEAKTLDREEFGEQRLSDVLLETLNKSAKETLEAIEQKVRLFAGKAPQHDDCTLIILKEKEI